ncbi:MAG: hypothetical protein D3918_12470 [Candidatus Electrothrix sp. AX2]|nr:hypothetical protein [Candidatus Electrothrix gigas]
MLQYLLKPVIDFLQKPSTQRAIKDAALRAVRIAATNPGVRREIAKSAEDLGDSVVEFFSSIKIRIVHRQDETKIIIDASISCTANNVNNSTVVQGKNIIVNNYYIPVFVHTKQDIDELEILLERLNNLENKYKKNQNTSIEIKNLINLEYKKLCIEHFDKLSKLTNYALLQKALGTED